MSRFTLKSLLLAGITISCVAHAQTQVKGNLSGTWANSTSVTALKTTDGVLPPLNAKGLALYNAHLAATKKGDRSWDPVAKCKPPGEPRTLIEMSWPFEIMQSDKRIDFLFQWNRLDRAIFMADKQELDALAPYYFGQSIAHWEGDTLVVSVIAVKPNTTLDAAGLPHSEDMELTERFRLIDGNTLEARIHVVDPAFYTKPWDTILTFKRQPKGTRIVEDVCIERLKLNDYATLENSLVK